jgi:hypothetical protein
LGGENRYKPVAGCMNLGGCSAFSNNLISIHPPLFAVCVNLKYSITGKMEKT